MKIQKMDVSILQLPILVDKVVRVYMDSFAGYPWYQTWEYEKVRSDFFREMQKENATCWVVYSSGEVVGFSWGYNSFQDLGNLFESEVFYLDEFAIAQNFQKKGIGTKFLSKVLSDINAPVILRTMADKPMHLLVQKFGGLDLKKISEDRVIVYISN